MNALQDNIYTRAWQHLGASIPKPKAILAISAHWYTQGTGVTAMTAPRTIHDFGGFPQALFDIRYPAPGDTARWRRAYASCCSRSTYRWISHGAWMYVAGAKHDDEKVSIVVDGIEAGSISMMTAAVGLAG